ncbi:MAG: GNAT family acetyltransferase [Deltaproteobacteria bacterium]|nr:GNAT family acetyltransferase [Deltaproteobacteria bacterium]
MLKNKKSNFNIRTFESSDTDEVIFIWEQCGLIRSWNNPKLDIQRKIAFQKEFFLVGEISKKIIATAMFGYDGHRGWLNYFAVLPLFQKKGFGRQLLDFGETILIEENCPKLNLQIRNDNAEAKNFYKKVGFNEDSSISFGKRLIED